MPDERTKFRSTSQPRQKSGDGPPPDHLGLSTQTALAGAVVVAVIAFILGRRAERKKARRQFAKSLPNDDSRTFRVSAETGVEVFYNQKGYKIRVEKTWEHRYLAAQCFGRPLQQDEVVHHVNGRRSDNRLENLCVLHHLKHEQFHSWLKWKKDKEGQYPAESVLRKILVSEYGGVLLRGEEVDQSSE